MKNYKPLQKGDVPKTNASIAKIKKLYKYNPKTKIHDGIKNFVQWKKQMFSKFQSSGEK